MKYPDPACISGATELQNISASGVVPRTRVADVKSAKALYDEFRKADKESAWNRRLVSDMYDGKPPHNPHQLKQLGQGHRFNLDFREAAAMEETALTAYNDLTESVDTLIRVTMGRGSPDERAEKAQIFAEEYTGLMRRWNKFHYNHQILAKEFVRHGVGIVYFPDDVDWRYQVSGLGDFLFPRGTEATEDSVEVSFCVRKRYVHQLYRHIEDEKAAAQAGYNVEMVKKAMMNARVENVGLTAKADQWEAFQKEIKNNDLFISGAKSKVVSEVHMWVQEFDGTVSHYIFDEGGQLEDFMFKAPSRFQNTGECFVFYTFGVGNGQIHGIRGQGYKIFPGIQASNRLRNAGLDAAFLELSLLVQSEDSDDLASLGLVTLGAISALPPGLKVAERQFQNSSAGVLPVMQDLSVQLQNTTGLYRPMPVDAAVVGRDRVTRAEVLGRAQANGTLTASAINLFYLSENRKHREVVRRLKNRAYQQDFPGGKEVFEFRQRLYARGVSFEDIQSIQDVDSVRAVGSGSAQLRSVAFGELMQYLGSLDEVGRNNLQRDMFMQFVGAQQTDRYVPRIERPRPLVDEQIAELENSDLRNGQPVRAVLGNNHAVHAKSHLVALQETIGALQQGMIDPQAAMVHISVGVPHTKEHLAEVAVDKTRAPEHAKLAEAVNIIENLGKQLANNLAEAAEAQMAAEQEMMAAASEGGGQVDPKLSADYEKHQLKLQMDREAHEQKMAFDAAEAQQKLAIMDLMAAAKVSAPTR